MAAVDGGAGGRRVARQFVDGPVGAAVGLVDGR